MGGHTAALSLLKAGGAEPSAVLRGSGEVSHVFVPVLSLFGTSVRNITGNLMEFVCTFRFYRRMSSTLLCALISLACALTFSGAQSEYNLASCNMETLNWLPFFNILWFHLFLMKAFLGMLQVFSACTRSYLLC